MTLEEVALVEEIKVQTHETVGGNHSRYKIS